MNTFEFDDSVQIDQTFKLQSLFTPIVGVYAGRSRGQHGKPDYLFKVDGKTIRILGIKDLHDKMSHVSVGSTIKVKYSHAIPSSTYIQYIADIEVLNG